MQWKTLSKEQIVKVGFISLDKEVCELPDGRQMPGYYILHFPDWVSVVARDQDGQFILVKQYRHATREVHLEIPGGGVHKNERPEVSAQRELREETGYSAKTLQHLSSQFPNPAIQDNKVHVYLADNCEYQGPQELDEYEDIEVVKMSLTEVEQAIKDSKINHTISVAALMIALRHVKSSNKEI